MGYIAITAIISKRKHKHNELTDHIDEKDYSFVEVVGIVLGFGSFVLLLCILSFFIFKYLKPL